MSSTGYRQIVEHYERCLATHGDTPKGVDWPNAEDAETRYRVMLDVLRSRDEAASVLDFGCGTARLVDYLQRGNYPGVVYKGLDLSHRFVDVAAKKYPDLGFFCADVIADPDAMPEADYVVMNGVFTEKRGLSFDEMRAYFERLLCIVFRKARRGVAFNVMSKHVDWERDDLFHLPYDTAAAFLRADVSRHFVFRADYGLYEYTTYVYREPR